MAPTVPNITFAVSWVWVTIEVDDIADEDTDDGDDEWDTPPLAICDNFPIGLKFDEADDLVLYDDDDEDDDEDIADDIDDSRSPLELPALAYAFAYGM